MSIGRKQLLIVVISLTILFSFAETEAATRGRVTGLELPRFVSLGSSKARLRVGPGRDYRIKWLYLRRGLPLEIIGEYGNWRRVRDHEGDTGWMHHSLLSGSRTAMAAPWRKAGVEMFDHRSGHGSVVARLSGGVLLAIDTCDGAWCRARLAKLPDTAGWIRQRQLWGVYPGERLRN